MCAGALQDGRALTKLCGIPASDRYSSTFFFFFVGFYMSQTAKATSITGRNWRSSVRPNPALRVPPCL